MTGPGPRFLAKAILVVRIISDDVFVFLLPVCALMVLVLCWALNVWRSWGLSRV